MVPSDSVGNIRKLIIYHAMEVICAFAEGNNSGVIRYRRWHSGTYDYICITHRFQIGFNNISSISGTPIRIILYINFKSRLTHILLQNSICIFGIIGTRYICVTIILCVVNIVGLIYNIIFKSIRFSIFISIYIIWCIAYV